MLPGTLFTSRLPAMRQPKEICQKSFQSNSSKNQEVERFKIKFNTKKTRPTLLILHHLLDALHVLAVVLEREVPRQPARSAWAPE